MNHVCAFCSTDILSEGIGTKPTVEQYVGESADTILDELFILPAAFVVHGTMLGTHIILGGPNGFFDGTYSRLL